MKQITLGGLAAWFVVASAVITGAQERPPAGAKAGTATAPATPQAAVPPELVGDWFWGSLSPTKYWNADTGQFVGHGYSGALSYVFAPDGTYKRYYYLETRLGGDVSGIFSASEGTVVFTGDTFTLKPAKGTYRFTDGRKVKERDMRQDELERPGLVFNWRLEAPAGGKPRELSISKPGEDPRSFKRSEE